MIPTLILLGIFIGLSRPYRTAARAIVALLVLAGSAVLWGALVAVGDQAVDPFGVALAAANGAVGWMVGAVVAAVASAVSMLARTPR